MHTHTHTYSDIKVTSSSPSSLTVALHVVKSIKVELVLSTVLLRLSSSPLMVDSDSSISNFFGLGPVDLLGVLVL